MYSLREDSLCRRDTGTSGVMCLAEILSDYAWLERTQSSLFISVCRFMRRADACRNPQNKRPGEVRRVRLSKHHPERLRVLAGGSEDEFLQPPMRTADIGLRV